MPAFAIIGGAVCDSSIRRVWPIQDLREFNSESYCSDGIKKNGDGGGRKQVYRLQEDN